MSAPHERLPEVGQAEASGMFAEATEGVLRIPEDSARRMAAIFDELYHDLKPAVDSGHKLEIVTGFPDTFSGHALTKGFSAKGREFSECVAALRETVLRFKAAFLAAGALFEEADQANAAAMRVVHDQLHGQDHA